MSLSLRWHCSYLVCDKIIDNQIYNYKTSPVFSEPSVLFTPAYQPSPISPMASLDVQLAQAVEVITIVMFRGNPWVQGGLPLPLPLKTPTLDQG